MRLRCRVVVFTLLVDVFFAKWLLSFYGTMGQSVGRGALHLGESSFTSLVADLWRPFRSYGPER